MKKIKIEFKYVMILLVVVIGVMLALSGTMMETKTMTAYKTTIDGSDSARVAKWDVVGLTKNNAANMNLNAGFSQEVKESGNWYFEIENKSEVNAIINNKSTVKFRLMHSSFQDNKNDTISWNFLNGKTNPVEFTIYAYNASANTMLTYKHKETNSEIKYDEYFALSTQKKLEYTEQFDKGTVTETNLGQISELTFKKKSEVIDGQTVYFYEATIDLSKLTDAESILGLGVTKTNTTFRVHWSVSAEGDSQIPQEVLNRKYYKYVISDTNTAIDGYSPMTGNYNDGNGTPQYIFQSTDGVDFFTYLKYTSTLGGQPMFEFLNSTGTQTLLVAFDKLSVEQKNTILSYSGSSVARQYWEYLTYKQYTTFASDNILLQDNLAYMSYGLKVQMIFNITVEQVD